MAVCTIAGCSGPAHGRGWCSKHYQRWQQHGDPEMVDQRIRPPRWFCECAEPDVRDWIGMCHVCFRKPRALMA